jgi:hypothetical protein
MVGKLDAEVGIRRRFPQPAPADSRESMKGFPLFTPAAARRRRAAPLISVQPAGWDFQPMVSRIRAPAASAALGSQLFRPDPVCFVCFFDPVCFFCLFFFLGSQLFRPDTVCFST